MTTAERLCEEIGVPIAQVCKKAQITPRTLNQYVIHGASSYSADRIAWAFDYKIDTKIFLWGYAQWKRLKNGDNRISPSVAGGDASHGQRPVNHNNYESSNTGAGEVIKDAPANYLPDMRCEIRSSDKARSARKAA